MNVPVYINIVIIRCGLIHLHRLCNHGDKCCSVYPASSEGAVSLCHCALSVHLASHVVCQERCRKVRMQCERHTHTHTHT